MSHCRHTTLLWHYFDVVVVVFVVQYMTDFINAKFYEEQKIGDLSLYNANKLFREINTSSENQRGQKSFSALFCLLFQSPVNFL